MKTMENPKKKAQWQYGFGVAKIFAGFWIGLSSSIILLLALVFWRGRGFLYVGSQLLQITFITVGAFLVYYGFMSCRLSSSYKKLAAATEYKNRESLQSLALLCKQDLTCLIRDLQRLENKGYFPGSEIDFERGEWVLRPDNAPPLQLRNGDVYFEEDARPSFKPLIALPAVFAGYAVIKPFTGLWDLIFAGVISFGVCILCIVKTPHVTVLKKKVCDVPPPPPPEPINTGNETMDEFLNASVANLKELNELSLAITAPKMLEPCAELLNITRQIFAFIEKHPEKLRQIRQFMNYYLPTTIKLLASYRDFSRETFKGENITASTEKIEDSMGGIVETFSAELDSLYLDKAVDISLDIDMMLAMMRQRGIQEETEIISEVDENDK